MATSKKILIITNGSTSSRIPNILSGMGKLSDNDIFVHYFSKQKKQRLFDELKTTEDINLVFIELRAFDNEMNDEFYEFLTSNALRPEVFNLLGNEVTPDIWKDNKKIAFKDFIKNHISEYQPQN